MYLPRRCLNGHFGSQYLAKNDEQLALICCGACAYLAALLLVQPEEDILLTIKIPKRRSKVT